MKKILVLMLLAAFALPFGAYAQTTTIPPAGSVQYVAPTFNLDTDGTLLVRGIVVSRVSTSTIEGSFVYGGWQLPMVISVLPETLYLDRAGAGSTGLSDITAGDTISFSGTFLPVAQGSVVALVVRNWTPAGVNGGAGTITPPLNSTNTVPSGTSSGVIDNGVNGTTSNDLSTTTGSGLSTTTDSGGSILDF